MPYDKIKSPFLKAGALKVAQASLTILLPQSPKCWDHRCKPHFFNLIYRVMTVWVNPEYIRNEMSQSANIGKPGEMLWNSVGCAFHNKGEERLCEGHIIFQLSDYTNPPPSSSQGQGSFQKGGVVI